MSKTWKFSYQYGCYCNKLWMLLLLFLWQMVEKLSHYHSSNPVESDGVLKYLLVSIDFRAMLEFSIWQIVQSLDSYTPIFLKWTAKQSSPVLSLKFATASFQGVPSNVYRLKNSIQKNFFQLLIITTGLPHIKWSISPTAYQSTVHLLASWMEGFPLADCPYTLLTCLPVG